MISPRADHTAQMGLRCGVLAEASALLGSVEDSAEDARDEGGGSYTRSTHSEQQIPAFAAGPDAAVTTAGAIQQPQRINVQGRGDGIEHVFARLADLSVQLPDSDADPALSSILAGGPFGLVCEQVGDGGGGDGAPCSSPVKRSVPAVGFLLSRSAKASAAPGIGASRPHSPAAAPTVQQPAP
ncbi:hypothetical protein Mth01_01710 [Sphaerimonospora thailandensis]|uniref:Uncharacterized protein n=1 Tax=Sphaerimonospora thailandensis TaxID=795644 RepID=A0A8J3R8E1_9ACTN|nr:hypothetical protein Mth01_01710 [Sphaerimonospora thailandensis]